MHLCFSRQPALCCKCCLCASVQLIAVACGDRGDRGEANRQGDCRCREIASTDKRATSSTPNGGSGTCLVPCPAVSVAHPAFRLSCCALSDGVDVAAVSRSRSVGHRGGHTRSAHVWQREPARQHPLLSLQTQPFIAMSARTPKSCAASHRAPCPSSAGRVSCIAFCRGGPFARREQLAQVMMRLAHSVCQSARFPINKQRHKQRTQSIPYPAPTASPRAPASPVSVS